MQQLSRVKTTHLKRHQGEYKEAITFYRKDLIISQKTLSSNDPDLANI